MIRVRSLLMILTVAALAAMLAPENWAQEAEEPQQEVNWVIVGRQLGIPESQLQQMAPEQIRALLMQAPLRGAPAFGRAAGQRLAPMQFARAQPANLEELIPHMLRVDHARNNAAALWFRPEFWDVVDARQARLFRALFEGGAVFGVCHFGALLQAIDGRPLGLDARALLPPDIRSQLVLTSGAQNLQLMGTTLGWIDDVAAVDEEANDPLAIFRAMRLIWVPMVDAQGQRIDPRQADTLSLTVDAGGRRFGQFFWNLAPRQLGVPPEQWFAFGPGMPAPPPAPQIAAMGMGPIGVRLLGAVVRPGLYYIGPGHGLDDALAQAEGLLPGAALEEAVVVPTQVAVIETGRPEDAVPAGMEAAAITRTRPERGVPVGEAVTLAKRWDPNRPLKNGDVVIIPFGK